MIRPANLAFPVNLSRMHHQDQDLIGGGGGGGGGEEKKLRAESIQVLLYHTNRPVY